MFTVKREQLASGIKPMISQAHCPTCNRRLFDGFLFGALEIICPLCHDRITLVCNQMTETTPPKSVFEGQRTSLNPMVKSMAEQVRCPNCNRRLFDGFFYGVLEIVCPRPRCHHTIVVTCKEPDDPDFPGELPEKTPMELPHENGRVEQLVAAPLTAVPA